jgi:hypothetical protein
MAQRTPFDRDLEAALATPVRLANDANCFALSAARDGAAENAHTVFGVILGTGCGGGVVVDGKLLNGPRGIGGEWGHNPLPWATPDEYPGPSCWCGRKGCLETWVSGPGMAADHTRVTGDTRRCGDRRSRQGWKCCSGGHSVPARRSAGAGARSRRQHCRCQCFGSRRRPVTTRPSVRGATAADGSTHFADRASVAIWE